MWELGMLMRAGTSEGFLASYMADAKVPTDVIGGLLSAAERAIICMPTLEEVCSMDEEACQQLLLPSSREEWQAVSAIARQLDQIVRLPNMEEMKMDLLEEEMTTCVGPPVQRGGTRGADEFSEEENEYQEHEEEDVTDWDIGDYVKRKSEVEPRFIRILLYSVIMALDGVKTGAQGATNLVAANA